MPDAPTPDPSRAVDVVANTLRAVSGRAGDGMAYAVRADRVVADLDAAGYEIVRKREGSCPICDATDPHDVRLVDHHPPGEEPVMLPCPGRFHA